jgi:hypothetical protein
MDATAPARPSSLPPVSTGPGSRPRQAAVAIAAGLLLIGPTALAFFAGGYFAGPRAWAGLGCWAAVVLGLTATGRLPRDRASLVALACLATLAVWTLVSVAWAPISGDAWRGGQIAVLYAGALLGAGLALRGRPLRAVEPALAAGVLIVVGYGLSERLLPGVLHFARSVSAEGRLEQPLTYWNAMGELAALGFVLCARLAGDGGRPTWLRAAAAGAAAPLGMGLYITFSRGALFAAAAGLVALTVLAPRREQLAGTLLVLGAGAVAAVATVPFAGVAALSGVLGLRERDGAIVLVLLVVIAALAAGGQAVAGRRVRPGELGLPPRAPLAATAVICAGLALAILVGAHESSGSQSLSGGATRLTSLQSNRYGYWSVALRAFATEPLRGIGAGGWAVDWLRWRTVNEGAQDAHSLELQTLAELGVVGAVLLLGVLGGIAAAARRALRASPAAAGPVAALVVYLAHSPLDWDWQMPAVTLVATALAGAVLALAGDAAACGA